MSKRTSNDRSRVPDKYKNTLSIEHLRNLFIGIAIDVSQLRSRILFYYPNVYTFVYSIQKNLTVRLCNSFCNVNILVYFT